MAPTLTDHLRGQSDEALAALLRARPDLIVPVPADLDALAARAQSRISVARVLDRLTRFQLEILDALRLTRDPDGRTSLDEVLAVAAASPAGADPAAVRAAVQDLRGYLLVYGDAGGRDELRQPGASQIGARQAEASRGEPPRGEALRGETLRMVAAVDEVLGPYPAGLGRPAVELVDTSTPGAAATGAATAADTGATTAADTAGSAAAGGTAAAALVGNPARLRRTLLSAPPAARAVLNRLAAGPPVGTLSEEVDPVAWLVGHGLLVATSPTSVELPREVGMLLRRDTGPLGGLHPAPPAPAAAPVDAAAVDRAGAGQAMEAVRLTAALLEALAAEPAPVLRSGSHTGRPRAGPGNRGAAGSGPGRGMGIRDVRRLARVVGVEEPVAALLIETGYAAGLLGETDSEHVPGRGGDLRPAAGYDAWTGAPLAARWHALARAWLTMTRQPELVGRRDGRDRLVGALTPEAERSGAPAIRRTVLGVLAALPAGTAPTPDEVDALVGWHAPRLFSAPAAPPGSAPQPAGEREPGARRVATEAAILGVTGRVGETGGTRGEPPVGALTSYGAALLAEGQAAAPEDDPLGTRAGDTPAGLAPAAAALAALLPAPVDELLVQADLTVVVPGPPEPALAAELELVAEHESAGGASVHRITRDSLRRALDAGYTAEDVHTLFTRRSRTEVPQALRYLVDDVARTHGGLRVGSAGAYLRSDDEALVAQVLADRRLAPLGLRRLAPTVLAAAAPAGRMLAALREAGYAPVPEDAGGAAVLVRPRARRAPPGTRTRPAAPADPFTAPPPSTPRLLGIVEDLRRRDTAARAARRAPATVRHNGAAVAGVAAAQAHTEAMAVLQQAVRDKALVWVRYVDSHGASTSRLLRPVSVGAGYLRAEDERTDTLHTFALHRITAAALDS